MEGYSIRSDQCEPKEKCPVQQEFSCVCVCFLNPNLPYAILKVLNGFLLVVSLYVGQNV